MTKIINEVQTFGAAISEWEKNFGNSSEKITPPPQKALALTDPVFKSTTDDRYINGDNEKEEISLKSDADESGEAKYKFYAFPGEYIPTMFDKWNDTQKIATVFGIDYKSRSENPTDAEVIRVSLYAIHNWGKYKESELFRLMQFNRFENCQYNCFSSNKFDPSPSIQRSFEKIFYSDSDVMAYCIRLTKYKKAMSLFNYQGNVFETINNIDLIKKSLSYPGFVTFIKQEHLRNEPPPNKELFRMLCAIKSKLGANRKWAKTDCRELAALYFGFPSVKDIPNVVKNGQEFKKFNHHRVARMLEQLQEYNVKFCKSGRKGAKGLFVTITLSQKRLEELAMSDNSTVFNSNQ